jgi:hypothetical protein
MRPVHHRLLAAALLAIALMANGCGKSTSPTNVGALTQDDADDMAVQGAAAMNQVSLDADGAVGSLGASAYLVARPGTLAAMAETTFTRGNLTIQASRNLYAAGDVPLDHYDPTAVKLVWTSRIFGTIETPHDSATVGHAATLEVRGIQPTDSAFVLNGVAADTLMNRFQSYDGMRWRYCYWKSALTIADVISRHGSSGPPLSGTVTFVVQADRLRSNNRTDLEAHLEATIVVTFNGTTTPTITVNERHRYHWFMPTGLVVRA